ncbi:protein kinase [Nannocystis sp. ILAH1]|uniref:serine/threonine protein kinase n=1 Tax=unclassified Nannocystis TaxID=2627009 RepID=UPI00226E462D|nr:MULTISPECIES: serine/threonine protein kinase [unclassified Nannocystis]MCY0990936.1 protein kinase [Nannocystis sp. ILAH1]MCY1064439.1 protein kinase [Nannocystis sp. RBIL2]
MATKRLIADLSGTTLKGRYHLQASIGAGGFASVYRAHDAHIGKLVAVKVLHPEHTKDIKDLERFRNEAAIAARIDDELLVRVTDYGQDGPFFFFVMEHLVGQSLREELRQLGGKPMSWVRAFRLAEQVCAALEVAHAHDIVHRDVKPENIFITQRRKSEAVKLLDLGIAKILQDQYWSGLQKNLSNTNDIIGSPCYITPEQIQGSKSCDARVDIYALGVVLYEMVTGVVPFRGNNVYDTMFQHVNAQPVPPAVRVPGLSLPSPLEAIVLRALEKDPRDRFHTVREMSTSIAFEMNHLRGERSIPRPARFLPALEELDAPPPGGPGASGGRPSVSLPGMSDPAAASPRASGSRPFVPPPRTGPPAIVLPAPRQESFGDSERTTPKRAPAPKTTSAPPAPPPAPQAPRLEALGDDLTPAKTSPPPKEQTLQTHPDMVGLGALGRDAPVATPPLPLSGATKFMLGSLVAASFMVTCSVGTVLAMTVDTTWIDQRLGGINRSAGPRIEEELVDNQVPPPVETKPAAAVPDAAIPSEEPEPENASDPAPERSIAGKTAPIDPSQSPTAGKKRAGRTPSGTPTTKEAAPAPPQSSPSPTPSPKHHDSDDDLLPIGRTMKAMAARVASKIRSECKISFLSSVERAEYQIVFHVHPTTGAILRVNPNGPQLPFKEDRCVEKLAESLVGSFEGATDLQATFPFRYTVVKQ